MDSCFFTESPREPRKWPPSWTVCQQRPGHAGKAAHALFMTHRTSALVMHNMKQVTRAANKPEKPETSQRPPAPPASLQVAQMHKSKNEAAPCSLSFLEDGDLGLPPAPSGQGYGAELPSNSQSPRQA